MCRDKRLTVEMVKEAPAGTTYSFSYGKSSYSLTVEQGSVWNLLRLSTTSGEYEYMSDWLELSPLLASQDMAPLLQEGARLFLARASLHSQGRGTVWKPLDIALALHQSFEHLLA